MLDSYEMRFKNLESCLEKVYKLDALHSVALVNLFLLKIFKN